MSKKDVDRRRKNNQQSNHQRGRRRSIPEEMFALPATIAGMQERMTVLKEEADHILIQLKDEAYHHQFDTEADYFNWRRKAQLAYDWKREERAWLVDKWQVALKEATDRKQQRRGFAALSADKQAEAIQKRRDRLAAWKLEHQDEELTMLVFSLYRMVLTMDMDDPEAPITDEERQVIRVARDYLRLNGVDGEALHA